MPRLATDYKNTIIYKLMCDDVDKVYIGSTTSFRHRKATHKNRCINDKRSEYYMDKYKYIRENGGWNKWKMI
jgi:predicted GIY-YIG superfamily endonuclease